MVKFEEGRVLVTAHHDRLDARQLHYDLKDHCLHSTEAKVESANALRYITNMSVVTWRKSYSSFMNHWLNSRREYEESMPYTSRWTPGTKRIHLENAVNSHEGPRAVRTQLEAIQSMMNPSVVPDDALLWSKCQSLLESAAAEMDAKARTSKRGGGFVPRRCANLHDFGSHDQEDQGLTINNHELDDPCDQCPLDLSEADYDCLRWPSWPLVKTNRASLGA